MSVATWLLDIALWGTVVVVGTVTILDMLNIRGDE